jgi:hypothetical protein
VSLKHCHACQTGSGVLHNGLGGLFPNCLLQTTASFDSDHYPLILGLKGIHPGKSRFHFEAFTCHEDKAKVLLEFFEWLVGTREQKEQTIDLEALGIQNHNLHTLGSSISKEVWSNIKLLGIMDDWID